MKIILLEDVYNQGVAGDMVDVAPGYARNYLIPNALAVKATPGAMKQLENLRASAEERRATLEEKNAKIAEQVEALTLYFPVKASERGKLFGSVTTAEISEQLKEEIGLDIDPRRVGDQALRELGNFSVPVRLETGLTPHVKVVVHREDVDPRAAEQANEEAEALAESEAELEGEMLESEFAEDEFAAEAAEAVEEEETEAAPEEVEEA